MLSAIRRKLWRPGGWPPGVEPAWMTMAGGTLVVVLDDGSVLGWRSFEDGAPPLDITRALGWRPTWASPAPSGRYVCCWAQGRTEVYDLDAASARALSVRDDAYMRPVSLRERDFVLVLDTRWSALACNDGSVLFDLERGTDLLINRTIPAARGAAIAIVAWRRYEPEDRLLVLDLDAAAQATSFADVAREIDVASRVSAGEHGAGQILCFRDPGPRPAGLDDDDYDELAMPEVRMLKGFYTIRLADGAVLDRIPSAVPGSSESHIVAVGGSILLRDEKRLFLVDRATGQFESMEGRAVALDTQRGCAAIASGAGRFLLVGPEDT